MMDKATEFRSESSLEYIDLLLVCNLVCVFFLNLYSATNTFEFVYLSHSIPVVIVYLLLNNLVSSYRH